MNTRIWDTVFMAVCLLFGIYALFFSPEMIARDNLLIYAVLRFFRPLAFLTVGVAFLFRLLKNPKLNAIAQKVSYVGIGIYVVYLVASFG